MCGIAGVHGFSVPDTCINSAQLILKRRGPDFSSIYKNNYCTLVHTRLSIIDLSDDGNQPMISSCCRYVLVFNGEIYNYKELRQKLSNRYDFKTHSDSEVILAAYSIYGESCLQLLRGMFAFAIYDTDHDSLFLARDKVGVKPLYFFHEGSIFAFASRPSAVIKLIGSEQNETETSVIHSYLHLGYVPGWNSIYSGVKKLLPGSYLTFKNKKINISKYWNIDCADHRVDLKTASEDLVHSTVAECLKYSVELRMRSDVPVGIFLSGGVDSTLIGAIVSQHFSKHVPAFSIGSNNKDYDETRQSRHIAQKLGFEYHHKYFGDDDLENTIEQFFEAYDEPFCDTSALNVMAVSELASQSGVKVVLTGDGGDEAFCGYPQYKLFAASSILGKFVPELRNIKNHKRECVTSQLGTLYGLLQVKNDFERYIFLRSYLKRYPCLVVNSQIDTISKMLTDQIGSVPILGNLSYLELAMRYDYAVNLPDGYLQKVDISTMAYSVEARSPFLDSDLIELAASIPIKYKCSFGSNKIILRKLLNRYFEYSSLIQKKKGFSVPIDHALRTVLRSHAESLFSHEDLVRRICLSPIALKKIWNEHLYGRKNHGSVLWNIFVLLKFIEKRNVKVVD